MKIELPKKFSLPAATLPGKPAIKPTPIELGFTGHIVIPDAWTGGDYEEFYKASNSDETWVEMWKWAQARIVEWEIEDVPKNPLQIKQDEHLTWPLMSFLANAVIRGMDDYARGDLTEIRDSINYPIPENLRPGEFLAWHDAMEEHRGDESKSPLLQGWTVGKVLVRGWPNGTDPEDYRKVDLRLMFAVEELLNEVILPSLNLGNWSALPGEV